MKPLDRFLRTRVGAFSVMDLGPDADNQPEIKAVNSYQKSREDIETMLKAHGHKIEPVRCSLAEARKVCNYYGRTLPR